MAKRTSADLLPVTDVWADDSDLTISPVRRYDWTALAEKAMEQPGRWLLVDPDGSPSTASNINNGLLKTIERITERTGVKFRARASDTYSDTKGIRRSKVWMRALPVKRGPGRPKKAAS